MSRATWIRFPQGAETLCSALAILCGVQINVRFYMAVLSVFLSFLDFVSGDLALRGFKMLT